jgi:hypothetical protein
MQMTARTVETMPKVKARLSLVETAARGLINGRRLTAAD